MVPDLKGRMRLQSATNECEITTENKIKKTTEQKAICEVQTNHRDNCVVRCMR